MTETEAVPLPSRSRLTVVDAGPERLVLTIRGGGPKAWSIGCFAVFWNAVTYGVGAGFFVAALAGGFGWVALFPLTILTVFAAIGLGMAVWAVKAAFTRTLLLVSPGQAAVQTIFFGRKSTRTVPLGPRSHARLEEAYRENDRPVHRVAIRGEGEGESVTFGTPLSEADKAWLVAAINARIATPETLAAAERDAETRPAMSLKRRLRTRARNVPPLDPHDLPRESLVRVEEQRHDRLRFFVPVLPSGPTRTTIAAVLSVLVLAGVAISVVAGTVAIGQGGPWGLLAALPGLIESAVMATILIGVLRGRIVTTTGPDRVAVRWHAGPLGRTLTVPMSAVEKVTTGGDTAATIESARHMAVLIARDRIVPITLLHGHTTGRQAAGLVRWQLDQLGHVLAADPANSEPGTPTDA